MNNHTEYIWYNLLDICIVLIVLIVKDGYGYKDN